MKRYITFVIAFLTALTMAACGDTSTADKLIEKSGNTAADDSSDYLLYVPEKDETYVAEGSAAANGYDVDLTVLNSNMTYSQVYDMVTNPDSYLGKSVRAQGIFAHTTGENGQDYFAVIIQDATACCGQGIEFVLKGDEKFPEDYPPLDTEIIVSGNFNTYQEGTYTYCQLLDADLEVA